ncbi:MAG: restriction endonuclease subunit S [Methanobrevibacter sp.]|nr:restriction endonuclease subunit S [Methanobrevibacter sp.]
MKDSGVVWIGEIPEDWNLKKLKYNLNNITDGSHISVNILSEGYPYVTVSDLNEINEIIDLENCKRISKQDYDLLVRNGCQPNRGDILFSQIGTIGLVVPVKRNNFVLLSSLAILTPSDNVIQRWLIHYLRSEAIKNQWRIWMAGGAIKRITLDHISNFIIVVPSLNEQERISNFFDKKTLAVDKTIEKNKKLIELLEEYKKSLINHACTGKLNVLKSQS